PVQGRTHDLRRRRDQSTELGALDAALAAVQQAADVSDETTRPVRLCARLAQQVEELCARGTPLDTYRSGVQQVGDRAERLAQVMREARCQIASGYQPEKLGDTVVVTGCEPLLRRRCRRWDRDRTVHGGGARLPPDHTGRTRHALIDLPLPR